MVAAGVLIGATVGVVVGRVVAGVYLINNDVSSTAIAIAQRMLVGGVIGAPIGLLVGGLAARRLRISFRTLLVGIAVTVGVGGLLIAAAVVQPMCTRLVPAPGTHGVGFTCVWPRTSASPCGSRSRLDPCSLPLLVAWASRHTDRIGG